MITRCICGKIASTKKPCKVCGNEWPMHHCHNRKHMGHVRTWRPRLSLDHPNRRFMLWPIDYAGKYFPQLNEAGEPNPDLEPCIHVHPYDTYAHMNEPHHELRKS